MAVIVKSVSCALGTSNKAGTEIEPWHSSNRRRKRRHGNMKTLKNSKI